MCVLGVGEIERLRRLAAAQRHGEEQVVVVDPAVACVIECREVLHQLDPALLEDAEA